MIDSSRIAAALTAPIRTIASVWRQLGDVDRQLDRRRKAPDCEYARVAAVLDDSSLARAAAWFASRSNPLDSRAVAFVAGVRRRQETLDAWQRVRLGGIAVTTALTVHASFYAVLPGRFAPSLPAIVWIGAFALGITLMAVPRAIVAAWSDFKK